MRLYAFAKRTTKEILRDPLTLFFGLGFPLVLLLLLSAIQANIPVSLFEIDRLTPGITIFGLSFMTLFAGLLLAKDRESALLTRLYATPMRAFDFIAGYLLPLLPMALCQAACCYLVALPLGLTPQWSILFALGGLLLPALFFTALGLLLGSLLPVKAVGGICGAAVTNLTAFLSGIWFDLSLVGGMFERVAEFLPFTHMVKYEQELLSGEVGIALSHIGWILGYTVAILLLSLFFFIRQMKKQ